VAVPALIVAPQFSMRRSVVDGTPDKEGIFCLWQVEDVLYVGQASDLRGALIEHLEGRHVCTKHATHYSWCIVRDADVAYREALAYYYEVDASLPPCNAMDR